MTSTNVSPRAQLMALRDRLAVRSNARQGRDIVRITSASCAEAHGAADVLAAFRARNPDAIGVGCDGRCYAGVRVIIEKPFKPTKSRSWFGHHGEEEIEETLHYYDRVTVEETGDILAGTRTEDEKADFFEHSSPIITEQNGWIDPTDLGDALARGAYIRFAEASQMTRQDLISFIERANIVERGGDFRPIVAGWRDEPAGVTRMIIRAVEGDAGGNIARHLIEGNPHRIVEGALIAAQAAGTAKVIFAIDEMWAVALYRLRTAVAEACAAGLIGESIFGLPLRINVEIQSPVEDSTSPEDSAGIEHYLETISQIPSVFQRGPEGYLERGVPDAGGTKVYALAGDIRQPCVAEMRFGSTLRDLIDGPGGGPTGRIRSINLDGTPPAKVIPAHLNDPVRPNGTVAPGTGGVTVVSD